MKAMPPREARPLERLRYWQGQMLRHRDFRAGTAIDAQFRWWHVRAMHRTSGIAAGFWVEHIGSNALIHRGLAFDWFGREVLLLCEQTLPLPRGEQPMVLLARLREVETRSSQAGEPAGCDAAGTGAELFWKAAGAVDQRDGVSLASWSGGKLVMSDRRLRPLSRPRMISGATIPRGTVWEPWNTPLSRTYALVGLETRVDFRAAGFAEPPCCFAWLEQSSQKVPRIKNRLQIRWHGVSDISAEGFTFQLLLWKPEPAARELPAESRVKRFSPGSNFFVSWLAVEPQRRNMDPTKLMEVKNEHPG
jgi:hypothetical protein